MAFAPLRGVRADSANVVSHDGFVPTNLPIGTVTFMFTDIEGSTRLLQALGADYQDVLERHAAIIRQGACVITKELKSARKATPSSPYSSRPKRQLWRLYPLSARSLRSTGQAAIGVRVRIGLHTGEGRLGGDSYVGLDVHRAARIGAAGHGGQILLSGASRALVQSALPEGVTLRELGIHRLKDLDDPEDLAEVMIAGLDGEFPADQDARNANQPPRGVDQLCRPSA